MPHTVVEAAEALMDQEIRVLDKGFVRMVDYMGGDQRIVQAARVSYGSGTKSFRQDRGLIHYLLRNRHTSPFEQVVLTFHIKMPVFVARQWIRHRMARLNEISGRYSVMKDEFYIPEPSEIRPQSTDNKQARSDERFEEQIEKEAVDLFRADQRIVYGNYQKLLDKGVAREVARINLPLSLYTEMYWQIDLHNLFHFLELRMDSHAQYEIRVYAEALAQCAKAVAPLAYEAFEEHILGGVEFGKAELQALAIMMEGGEPQLEGRNKIVFEQKMAKLRAAAPAEPAEEPVPPALDGGTLQG
ncbi:FAD-dependent thymidylate synthase [bacterium]|nr:MAG: FAD-dependent thymidylate synthase [bacterium]